MTDIEKIDRDLYKSVYIDHIPYGKNELWKSIKRDSSILRESVKVVRNKWDSADMVKGLTICDAMLTDYNKIDPIAYLELIKQIYNSTDIARTVIDGAANGGYSFLLLSLFNPHLKLSQEQKEFAVNEAMNKIGTIKCKEEKEAYSKSLDEKGITDEETTYLDIDGIVTPIGAKTKCEYFNNMFRRLSDTQAHGIGEFDIRYAILKNPNWSISEKEKLVYDFWYDDEYYDYCLDQWEWDIINNYIGENEGYEFLEISNLYDYTYDELLEFYKDETTAIEAYESIAFCKLMHMLRPQSWEKEYNKSKVLKLKSNE